MCYKTEKYKNNKAFVDQQKAVNDITIGYEPVKIINAVLPVNLLSFTGKTDGNKDILNRVTANEVNTNHFVIQKSTDGIAFMPAGSVKATSNEGGNTNYYRFTYSSVSNPSGFYRLQTADKDGSFTYSKVIRLQRITNAAIIAFYNSSARQINIMNNSNTACEWKLFSANGSAVKQRRSADCLIQINTSGIVP